MMYVSHDNAEHATTDFFDMEYQHLPIRMKDPNSDNFPVKPREFEENFIIVACPQYIQINGIESWEI